MRSGKPREVFPREASQTAQQKAPRGFPREAFQLSSVLVDADHYGVVEFNAATHMSTEATGPTIPRTTKSAHKTCGFCGFPHLAMVFRGLIPGEASRMFPRYRYREEFPSRKRHRSYCAVFCRLARKHATAGKIQRVVGGESIAYRCENVQRLTVPVPVNVRTLAH